MSSTGKELKRLYAWKYVTQWNKYYSKGDGSCMYSAHRNDYHQALHMSEHGTCLLKYSDAWLLWYP